VKRAYLPILIAVGLLLFGVGRAASEKPRPNQHKKAAAKLPDSTQQNEVKELLSVLQASETAFLGALRTIEHQAEAERKQARPEPETYSSPSVKVQIGLLIVGVVYSLLAALQWSAIREQGRIANESLRISQRANLGIEDIRFEDGRVKYRVRNSGHTTATEINGGVYNLGTSAHVTHRILQLITDPFGRVMSPGESEEHEAPLIEPVREGVQPLISKQNIADAIAGKIPIQIGIAHTYMDGFDNQRTSWRFFLYEPELNRFRPHGARQD